MYLRNLQVSVNKILSFLDQDINSPSVGLFDRYYWSWKKRDFPDSTLQYALLPCLKVLPHLSNKDFYLKIVSKAIEKLMYNNGSIDQSYPFEYHPKTFLDISSILAEFIKLSPQNKDNYVKLYKRGIDFSIIKEEEYGIICNHVAHHAYEYLVAYSILDEEIYYSHAISNIKFIRQYTDKEGWHQEYLGGDPGYQSRSLRYLTKCIDLLKEPDKQFCIDLCIDSASFLDKVVMPDGTLYEMFGSRNTAILYPSGIEYMALNHPKRYSNLAARVRRSIESNIAILPLQLDFDNFIRLFDDFIDANTFYSKNIQLNDSNNIAIEDFDLQSFGLRKTTINNNQLYIHYKYGGALAVYDEKNLLKLKNAGILLESCNGHFWGSRNLQKHSNILINSVDMIKLETEAFESIHQNITPIKLILVRLLNLSILRFPFFADLFRNVIVKALITGKKGSNNKIIRIIEFSASGLKISNLFNCKFSIKCCWNMVNLNLFHMASSRYLHPANDELSLVEQTEMKNNKIEKCYDL